MDANLILTFEALANGREKMPTDEMVRCLVQFDTVSPPMRAAVILRLLHHAEAIRQQSNTIRSLRDEAAKAAENEGASS